VRKLLPIVTLILIGAFAAHGQTAKAEPGSVPPGWRALFNGKDLDGWAVADARGKPAYTVDDGAIRTQTGNGLLWYTREKIGNATLRVVYRMANSQGRSGVLIRIPAEPPNEAFAAKHGMVVSLDDRGDDWHVTGVLDSLTKALSRPFKPGGEWNTMDITMQGLRTIVKLNGALVTDYNGVSPESGYIALRHLDDQATIWFREISIR
jgi:hypothetical protein